jgi:acetyl-CoA carboxylase carboxyltransferase component
MGLEGFVKLGYRGELAALEDPAARKKLFDEMVARMYEQGKALSTASHFEIDDVIDPMDSRKWILAALGSAPDPTPRRRKKRPCIAAIPSRTHRFIRIPASAVIAVMNSASAA